MVKFAEKTRHQIFLEPEGYDTYEVYPNGISTSMDEEVQRMFVHAIPGLENVKFLRPGYAIEYDFVDPRELYSTLETKAVNGLFHAGQINGTSGYEEAAGQGIVAGLNAAMQVLGREPVVLDRARVTYYSEFVLGRSDLPQAVRADVEQMREAAERSAAITAQLLAFSRRQMLQPVPLDLNTVVRDLEPVLRRTLGEAVTLELRLEPLAWIRADRGQLQQVLLNLALNARDAMPLGGRVVIETAAVELGDRAAAEHPEVRLRRGRYALLSLTDTGHGMDRETASHVFEPFFTTKGVGKGTGLGLSTVYGIVKQSDGYIWVESEPGRGATFRLYLPMTDARAAAQAREPPARRRRQRDDAGRG